jgi:hypothetical protein
MEEILSMPELQGLSPEDILKAISAGTGTGRDYNNTVHNGEGLKVESLEGLVKVLEYDKTNLPLWNETPKEQVYNTVHEFNQLVRYGEDIGYSLTEGEAPQETDTAYRRKSTTVAFMGLGGRVTHPATLVKRADGANPMAKEVESKTLLLMKQIDAGFANDDTKNIATKFKGIFAQHQEAIAEIAGVQTGTSAQKLEAYRKDPAVIDARGKALSDTLVENAMLAAYDVRYATPTHILGAPTVFSNYVKRFHESKRIVPGINGSVENATMGQSVNRIMTQFGAIQITNDIFFDKKEAIVYNQATNSTKAPAAPVPDATTPIAVNTDTLTRFTDGAGDYLYALRARNRYGLSAAVMVSTTAQAVTATQSVDIKFAAGSGSYAAESFVIYRTKKSDVSTYQTVKYYPIAEISAAELTGGYDGGAASIFRDRNRFLPETNSAIVYEKANSDILKYIQLLPISRMDFAVTAPSFPFAVLNYGSPQLGMPGKIIRIINLGSDLS